MSRVNFRHPHTRKWLIEARKRVFTDKRDLSASFYAFKADGTLKAAQSLSALFHFLLANNGGLKR